MNWVINYISVLTSSSCAMLINTCTKFVLQTNFWKIKIFSERRVWPAVTNAKMRTFWSLYYKLVSRRKWAPKMIGILTEQLPIILIHFYQLWEAISQAWHFSDNFKHWTLWKTVQRTTYLQDICWKTLTFMQ
jgi:hypothetical protein